MNLDREREAFSRRLRERREARELSVADVARITKIPERSLQLLEAGSFEKLPGDVFVRGFLKSYCRAVGADADQALRSYGELSGGAKKELTLTRPAPIAPREPDVLLVSRPADLAEGSTSPIDAAPPAAPVPAAEDAPATGFLGALSGAGRSTRRMSLTVAVIILVIVATLTLSFLLRRPSHVGDGLSRAPVPAAPPTA